MGLPANSSQNLFDPSVPVPFHSLRVDFSVGVSNARPLCACRPLPSHQPRRSRFHPTSDCSQSIARRSPRPTTGAASPGIEWTEIDRVGVRHTEPEDVTTSWASRSRGGVDGTVYSSPLRTGLTERIDKKTAEIRPVRQDPARHLYGEAGQVGMAWGTKFAIASLRSPMSGHRVVLGVEHVPPRGGGGEAVRFVDLMVDLAGRSPGSSAPTPDISVLSAAKSLPDRPQESNRRQSGPLDLLRLGPDRSRQGPAGFPQGIPHVPPS